MRRLKTIFACMLMAIFSVGQVWGTTYQHIFSAKPSTGNNVTLSGVSWNISATQLGNYNSNNYAGVQLGTKSASGSITLTSSSAWGSVAGDYKDKTVITEVRVWMNAGTGTPTGTVTIGGVAATDDGTTVTKNSSASSYTDATCVTYTPASTGNTGVVVITVSTSSKAGYICAIEIDCEEESEDPTPSLFVTPTSWGFGEVAVSDVADKEFLVSGSNLTVGTLSIAVPEGFSVSPSSITVSEATLASTPVTVSKNTTTIDDYSGNLSFSGCGLAEAKNVALEMSVVADPEPTGTFEKFSGDIVEGDYVICSGTTALKNARATNTNYIGYETVTVNNDEIDNPSENLIWHIAQSGGYWTIHNVAANNYAASTGAKNRGQVLTDISGDNADKALWTTSGSSTYEFVNKANTTGSVNANLRYNSGYGFACYSTSTGAALTLYKKQVEGQPATPEFSVASGNYEEAQSVEISCATIGAKIYYTLDGSKPSSTSTEYSTAIPVSATTTIKAVAIKDEIESTVATATYTIIVWQTVADVWNDITAGGPTNAHIYGYVSQINVGGYGNNFYISDNGSTEGNQLYAYRMDMNNFTVAVGDKVKLAGDLTLYNDVKEFKYTNADNCGKVITLEAKGDLQSVAVSGTPTKTEYAANEDFDPAGLVVTATYASGYAVNVASELAAADWTASPATITEAGNVSVTATYGGQTSDAYLVPVTILAATLESITLSYDAVEVYQGKPLPKPVVTAHWSDATESDVSALAEFDGYDASTTGEQLITVSYTFGGDTEEENYTVTVNPIYNVELAASVAKDLIETVVGNTESTSNMIVRGIVSQVGSISSASLTYYISDDGTTANQLEIYKGKYLDNADFTNDNKLKVGDEVVVTGKVIYYNNSTAEFANGKSAVTSLARTPNFSIADIASFEVGSADLVVADLTITQDGEGAVTLPNDGSDNTDAVTIVEGKLHAVAVGTATITANLAANGIYKAASTTFSVTVVAPVTKYAISFDGNGATGGSAPEAIADKAAGAEVTLPANSYTKTGYAFDGWKVINNSTSAEVEVTAGAFEMPASAVTIQAQWAEISAWASVYTSNVTLSTEGGTSASAAKIKFYGEEGDGYDAIKAGTGSAQGAVVVNVPAGATALHFHAYGWNSESVGLTVTAPTGVTVSPATEISINSNSGIASNSPFTLAEGSDPKTDAYYAVSLSGNTEPVALTISATTGKRFVLFGVNQEGGVLPVLQSIAIDGDLTTKSGYKTGDEIDPTGLTVSATYTLGGTPQTPIDITSDPALAWSHAALTAGQTVVTLTATYQGQTDDIEITLDEAVVSGDPEISTDVNSRSWTVEKDAAIPDAKTFAVTLKNIASATVTLGGDNPEAFSVSPATLTASGNITVSVVSTATVNTYSATITIKDDASETSKTVNVNLTVNAPVVEETAVSTTSEWVAAEAADLVDGAEVLITGATGGVTYAIGVQNDNNRAAVLGTLSEGVFTPGENTMSFTLVAQEEEGVFALQASNGEYLYAASSSKNYLKRQATLDDNAKWTLTATSAVANGSNTHNDLKFNATNSPKIFSCYTGGQTAIKLYVPKPEVIRGGLSAGTWGTICPKKEVKHPTGAAFYTLTYKEVVAGVPYKVFFDEIPEGASLEAGKPYLFVAESEAIRGVKVGAEVSVGQKVNGLVGVIITTEEEYQTVTVGPADVENHKYYIINNNQIRLCGVSFLVPSERAYIDMSEIRDTPVAAAPGRRRLSIGTGAVQSPTGLDAINADAEQAQKLIIDGKLYIIRGGHVYNPAGQLVK